MTSEIRSASKSDLENTEEIRCLFINNDIDYKIVENFEKKGFRAIDRDVGYASEILLPSEKVLAWDGNPDSLNQLDYNNQEESKDAKLYLAMTIKGFQD